MATGMKLIALIAMAFTLIGAAPAQKRHHAPASGLRFVDFTDDFDRIWSETKYLPGDQRVEAFEAGFAKVIPGFYSAKRVSDFITPAHYHELILKGLKEYPEHRAGIRRVSRQFAALVTPARRDFEKYFGVMQGYPPVYLVVSFGEFDGGTRDLADGNHLMFGADMIDRLYKNVPMKPLVEHELFHLMHGRTFSDCNAVWCNLWEEGLATYVAATLNPGAGDAALGLTVPEPIRPAVEAKKVEAICAVRQCLESEKPDDYASLFYGNKKIAGFPPRMGYYVGYLAVQEASHGRDLKQLAALAPKQVKPILEQALARMASCSAGERG